MPKTALVYLTRKPGSTPSAFKAHYENIHVALILSSFGEHRPTHYTRRYVERADSPPHAATVMAGKQEDVPYDVVTELVFDNEEKFAKFNEVYHKEEVKSKITEDEEKFLDKGKTVVVMLGDTCVS